MFAIRDERKRVVGFGARIFPAPTRRKGRNTSTAWRRVAYQKSEILYGLDVALEAFRQQKEVPRRLVLMEGYTDCLAAWQAGFPFAVATCGTALTPMQLRKLRQHAETIVLMFDGDKAGERAAQRALDLFLSSDLLVRIALLPGGKDPADYIREHGLQPLIDLVDKAPDALEFALKLVNRSSRPRIGRRSAGRRSKNCWRCWPRCRLRRPANRRLRFDATIGEIVATFGADERSREDADRRTS